MTVETPAALPVPRPRRSLRPVIVPPSLLDLHGHWVGELVLPQRLCWSLTQEQRRFNLGDWQAVAAAYGYVLDAASSAEDLVEFVNPWLLVAVWDLVPMGRGKRLKWEARHPVLRRAAAATAA